MSVAYRLEDYLGECVWTYATWNTERAWGDAQVRIGAAIERAIVGTPVELSDDDAVKLLEANAAATLSGVHAPQIRRLQQSLADALAPPAAAARSRRRPTR